MKTQVLIDMPINELHDLLDTEREKLVRMKMSHAVSPLENPIQIRSLRRSIARIATEMTNRESK